MNKRTFTHSSALLLFTSLLAQACLDPTGTGTLSDTDTTGAPDTGTDVEPTAGTPTEGSNTTHQPVLTTTEKPGTETADPTTDDTASTTSDNTSTSGTELTPAICGDSDINPEDGEMCDDGNIKDGDGCSADCKTERLVFISSRPYQGDLNAANDNPFGLTGHDLADYRCTNLAADSGISGIFRAWISDNKSSPKARFDTNFNGNYLLLDGSLVAQGFSGLTSGALLHPINMNEAKDDEIISAVWSNTGTYGTMASTYHCLNWTSKSDDESASLGYSNEVNSSWTHGGGQICSMTARLYCIEDIATPQNTPRT